MDGGYSNTASALNGGRGRLNSSLTRSNSNSAMASFAPSMGPMQVRRTFFSNDAPGGNLNPIENLLDYGSNIRSSMKVRPSTSKLTFFSYDLLPRSFDSSSSTTIKVNADDMVKVPLEENPRPSTTPCPHQAYQQQVELNRAKSSIMADLSIGSGWDADIETPPTPTTPSPQKQRNPPQKKQPLKKTSSKSSALSLLSLGRGPWTGKRPSPSTSVIHTAAATTAATPARSKGRSNATPTKKTVPKTKKAPSTFTRSEFGLSSGSQGGSYGSSSIVPPKLPKELLQKLESLLHSDHQGQARALSGYATGGGGGGGRIHARRETIRRLRAAHQLLEAELEKLHVVERNYVRGNFS